ncbi:MAG TPA: hypothetical protein VGM30_17035 [Puia sp.]|jgi:hypothetical protein
MITQISTSNIEDIVHDIQEMDYDCNKLSRIVTGEIKYQKVSDTYNKIIIERVSDNIKTVIIDCVEGKIKSIAFYGSLNIQIKEIFNLFKNYREYYSVHDDLYFYIFNEEQRVGNYVLSFFDPSPKKNEIQDSNEYLFNLILSW